MKPPVETISIKEKIKLQVLPALLIVAGLSLIGTGAFLLFKAVKQPPQQRPQSLVFQPPSRGTHAPGQILVKFKPGTDVQQAVSRVLEEPQTVNIDDRGRVIEETSGIDLKNPKPYRQKKVPLELKGVKDLLPRTAISQSGKEKISTRGNKDPQATMDKFQFGQWKLVEVNADASVSDLVQRFSTDSRVEHVEANIQYSLAVEPRRLDSSEVDDGGGGGGLPEPNDPFFWSSGTWGNSYPDLWGLKRVKADRAWNVTKGNAQVIVAVSDTGIDYNHPDLQGQIWSNEGEIPDNLIDDDGNGYVDDVRGWNFAYFPNNDPRDCHGHGTHVAGTIGARSNNGMGIAGMAWNVKLLPIVGLDCLGYGYEWALAAGLLYAVNAGADVINMSWGGQGHSQLLANVLQYAYEQRLILVAAAGNSLKDVAGFIPASLPNVLAVAAWSPENSLSLFSNWGDSIDIAAPGTDTLSLRAEGTDMYCQFDPVTCRPEYSQIVSDPQGRPIYYRADGTSMAAPHVSGVAALIRSLSQNFSPELIEFLLTNTSEHLTDTCTALSYCRFNPRYSCYSFPCSEQTYEPYGVLNAEAALLIARDMVANAKPELLVLTHSAGMGATDRGQLSATIANRGNVTATNIHYQIYAGAPGANRVIEDAFIQSLAPGETSTVNLTLSPDDIRDLFLTILIDPESQIQEYIENNNEVKIPVVPQELSGWPQYIARELTTSSPTVKDIDGNGILDIVIGDWESFGGGSSVYALQADGQPVPGWPQRTDPLRGEVYSSPAVADIDGDGDQEVIVGTGREGRVYVWRQNAENRSQWEIAPGWPKQTGESLRGPEPWRYRIVGSPATADIDRDGLPEVIIGAADGNVYVWNADGSNVPGWPRNTGSDVYSTPTIADIDGDGLLEIIAGTLLNQVYAWHADGTQVSGWPVAIDGLVYASPAVADIDGDGKLEIAIGDTSASADLTKFYVWRSNGTIMNGWPISLRDSQYGVKQFNSSPVIGDIDYDGTLEIVTTMFSGDESSVHIWKPNGASLAGWPKTLVSGTASVAPTLADLDGDNRLEIVLGHEDNLYVWRSDGSNVPGWPQKVIGDVFSTGLYGSPAVVDLDGDGRLEVIAGSKAGELHVWTFPIVGEPNREPWPTFKHDLTRTGKYPDIPVVLPLTASTIPQCVMLLPGENDTYTTSGLSRYQPFSVVIRDNDNRPVANASVTLDFFQVHDLALASQQAQGVTVDCTAKQIRVTTDDQGRATFVVRGAGRQTGTPGSVSPSGFHKIKVYVNGVLTKFITATTPDQNGAAGSTYLPFNGVESNDRKYLIYDLFNSSTVAGRSDLNCNGSVDGSDLSIFLDFESNDAVSQPPLTTSYCR